MAPAPRSATRSDGLPAPATGLNSVLARNIRALMARRQEEEAAAGFQHRAVQAITGFAGSLPFVYLHLVLFGGWIAASQGWLPYLPRFDRGLFVLPLFVTLEAIFLSVFVLITQNRMAAVADKRADLDLQINLLTEHELTRLIHVVSALAEHMGVESEVGEELDELKSDVAAEAVLDEIETATEGS